MSKMLITEDEYSHILQYQEDCGIINHEVIIVSKSGSLVVDIKDSEFDIFIKAMDYEGNV